MNRRDRPTLTPNRSAMAVTGVPFSNIRWALAMSMGVRLRDAATLAASVRSRRTRG
jgi:hypothetical protein